MPDRHGVTLAIQDQPHLGDRLLEVVHGRRSVAPPALPPIIRLAQRLRRAEIQIIALRVAQPSQRLWRYGHRWRVRLLKLGRWLRQQYHQGVRR